MSSDCGKVEADVEIKASAAKFHEMFTHKPHHISNVSNSNIQGCDLHEGDWGTVGSVVYWNYFQRKALPAVENPQFVVLRRRQVRPPLLCGSNHRGIETCRPRPKSPSSDPDELSKSQIHSPPRHRPTSPLPSPRYAPATQLWRGRLHVMGGSKENRHTPGTKHWSLGVKDGKALEKEWRKEVPIPRGGSHRACVVYNDRLFVIGGSVCHSARMKEEASSCSSLLLQALVACNGGVASSAIPLFHKVKKEKQK